MHITIPIICIINRLNSWSTLTHRFRVLLPVSSSLLTLSNLYITATSTSIPASTSTSLSCCLSLSLSWSWEVSQWWSRATSSSLLTHLVPLPLCLFLTANTLSLPCFLSLPSFYLSVDPGRHCSDGPGQSHRTHLQPHQGLPSPPPSSPPPSLVHQLPHPRPILSFDTPYWLVWPVISLLLS